MAFNPPLKEQHFTLLFYLSFTKDVFNKSCTDTHHNPAVCCVSNSYRALKFKMLLEVWFITTLLSSLTAVLFVSTKLHGQHCLLPWGELSAVFLAPQSCFSKEDFIYSYFSFLTARLCWFKFKIVTRTFFSVGIVTRTKIKYCGSFPNEYSKFANSYDVLYLMTRGGKGTPDNETLLSPV